MKKFNILTLFPELFPGPLNVSIFGKSLNKFWELITYNLRDFGVGDRKIVDDTVFGGLPGMLIKPDTIMNAMNHLKFVGKKIFLSPRGKILTQQKIEDLIANNDDFLILCGRYEGVDQRAINYYDFEEISIGNYVIAGGESAAFVLLESMIRKISGVIGNQSSFENESFVNNEISEDRYTRPADWKVDNQVISVPDIILSGNHSKIKEHCKRNRKKIVNLSFEKN